MKLCLRAIAIALVFVSSFAAAQVAIGQPLYGTFGGGPFDVINLGNLNVHFSIPVLHKAGRGLNFNYDLAYDSSIWDPVTVTVNGVPSQQWNNAANWGWAAGIAPVFGSVTVSSTQRTATAGNCTSTVTVNSYAYVDPEGSAHAFAGTTSTTVNSCTGTTLSGNLTATASDGSAYKLTATASGTTTVTSSSGHQLTSNCTSFSWLPCATGLRTDANGNQISANSLGQFFDTLSSSTPVLSQTGSGTPTSPIALTYTGPTGNPVTYSVNFSPYTVQTNFGVPGILEVTKTANLVSSVALPDGTSYAFSYEQTSGSCVPQTNTSANCVTGRIAQVTLPTGGSISYQYSGGVSGAGAFADGSTGNLDRTLIPGGTWQYMREPQDASDNQCYSCKTTVTDPQGNQTVSNFTAYTQFAGQVYVDGTPATSLTANPTPNLYMDQQIVYQGNAAPNNILSTTTRTYTSTALHTLPIQSIVTKTQLPNGTSRSSTATYNGVYPGSGLVDSIADSDFSGQTLREINVSYASLGNGIIDKPQTVVVSDGGYPDYNSWILRSETDYSYDQSATAGTFAPQHISISGSHGNLTTVSKLVSTGVYLSSTYKYYDTGLVYQSYDVNTTTYPTTFTYGYCGYAFPSLVVGPTGLRGQATWDCNGAVQLSATDANGNTTKSTYADPYFWRPTSTTDAAGNVTTLLYSKANASPITSEAVMTFNGGASATDVLTTIDAFGRPLSSQVKQSPGSAIFDTVSYGYDLLGRQTYQSIPYAAGASVVSTAGQGQTTSYDALARPTNTTAAGGGFANISYAQGNNDVLVTKGPAPGCENPKQRQNEYDGLGRLTSVCEMSNAAGSGSKCGQNTPQTGYWTRYAYNTLGQITNVVQNAQAASAFQQTRVFSYDLMGRMLSESNPENGLSTYTYDTDPQGQCASSKGDLIKKVDAALNVTCIAYDLLHRPTSVTYPVLNSASTPAKYFVYDSASVNGVPMSNTVGRLAKAYTVSPATEVDFSYSVTGATTDAYEKTPNSGGIFFHTSAAYYANGSPNTLNIVLPTATAGFTYGVDGEGRARSASTSLGQSMLMSSASYNAASQVTGLQYGTGDTDTFVFDPNSGRMVSYQYKINGQQPVSGSLTWNTDGSLGLLAITDPFNAANSQTCSYSNDDLGRAASVSCLSAATQQQIWQQTFSYGPLGLGNINKSSSVGASFLAGYSTATNHIASGMSASYDPNGNMTYTDGDAGPHNYLWSADGNLASVDGVTNTFDALGRVVEQSNSGTVTQTIYAPWGAKLALVGGLAGAGVLQKAFIPLPGSATAVYNNSGLAYYRHPDWLGSSRFASTPARTMYYSGSYAPFGESYSESLPGGTPDRSFTGQNQDTESGLYDFPTRGYSPGQGRWLSPDKAGLAAANPNNPQSWNRYAYVNNKPLRSVDPLGEDGYLVYCGTCSSSDDDSSENSDDSIGDQIVDIFDDIGNFFSRLFGGGGGGGGGHHSSPPAPLANGGRNYVQSGVSSSAVHSISVSTGSSVPVNGDPDVPSPANNLIPGSTEYALAVFSQPVIGNAAGFTNFLANLELDVAGFFFPVQHLGATLLAGSPNDGVAAAGISRKPGSLGLGKGRDALRAENKVARDILKSLGLPQTAEMEGLVHSELAEGALDAGRKLTYREGIAAVKAALGLL